MTTTQQLLAEADKLIEAGEFRPAAAFILKHTPEDTNDADHAAWKARLTTALAGLKKATTTTAVPTTATAIAPVIAPEFKDRKIVTDDAEQKKLTAALFTAIAAKKRDAVRSVILAGVDFRDGSKCLGKDNATPLHAAIEVEHNSPEATILRMLLSAGVSPTYSVRDEYPPIFYAAAFGGSDAVRALLAAGAPADQRSKLAAPPGNYPGEGCTPLAIAAMRGNSHIIKILLEEANPKADLNARTNRGETALWLACLGADSYVTAKQLMAAGADVNIPSNDGRMPLHLVAAVAHQDMIAQLVDRGADITAKCDMNLFSLTDNSASNKGKNSAAAASPPNIGSAIDIALTCRGLNASAQVQKQRYDTAYWMWTKGFDSVRDEINEQFKSETRGSTDASKVNRQAGRKGKRGVQ